jgi:hypothetical protein
LDEFSASQAAFTLVWSRPATLRQVEVAADLIERLPSVFAAVRSGRIDAVRAVVFSQSLAGLDEQAARRIADGLIDKAARLTAGQLRERLRYRVLKADPSLAKKRYQQCVADRRVYNQPYHDGTAELAGVNLPPQLAAAAYDRINRLAKAARAAGDVRTLPQLRADAYLDLLIGKPFQLMPSTDVLTREADQMARDDGLTDVNGGERADGPPTPKPRPPGHTRPASGFWERPSDNQPARHNPTSGTAARGTKAGRDGARHNPHDHQDQPAQRVNRPGPGHRLPAPDPDTRPMAPPGTDAPPGTTRTSTTEQAPPGSAATRQSRPGPPGPVSAGVGVESVRESDDAHVLWADQPHPDAARSTCRYS